MRAVKGSLGHSLELRFGELKDPRLGVWHVLACQWVGVNDARSGGLIRAVLDNVHKQAWKDYL
jgi:hypothetical protein